MYKKLSYSVFILLFFITFLIPTTKASAALLIGGDSYETIDDGWGMNYFSIKPVIERLEGVETSDSNMLQYTITSKDQKDTILLDKTSKKITVNGTLTESTYYEENHQIYVPLTIFEKMRTVKTVDSDLIDIFILAPNDYNNNDIAVYNLGTENYKLPKNMIEFSGATENEEQISFDYNGSVCVPEGKKLPLVIFLHGSYMRDGLTTYYDLGFADNMKALAKEGFVSLGINLTPVYALDTMEENKKKLNETEKGLFTKILKKHIESLQKSVNGEENPYGFDMKDKIDFNNIILVGHSRGGQNLFLGYDILKEMGYQVKGTLSIAPANYWPAFSNYPDVPAGIILPQLDGDVHTMDGRQIFDRMRSIERASDIQLLYLYSANHNNFNSLIFKEDNSFVDVEGNTLKSPMNAKDQRTFASNYMVDFSKACIKDGSLSKISCDSIGKLYNQHVLMSFVKGNSKVLFDTVNKLDSTTLSENIETIIASTEKTKHTAGNIRLPGLTTSYPLASLRFYTAKEIATFAMKEKTDFTKFDTLNFEIMQDSTEEQNKKENQQITITLVDQKGKTSAFTTPKDAYALQYQPGKMVRIALRDKDAETMYSNLTPLSTLSIPLKEFGKEIDLSNIVKIELSSSEKIGQGKFILQSISLSTNNQKKEETTLPSDSKPVVTPEGDGKPQISLSPESDGTPTNGSNTSFILIIIGIAVGSIFILVAFKKFLKK